MTTSSTRPTLADWPGLYDLPSGLRDRIATPVARGLFRAAVSRLDVSVELEHGPGRRELLGRGGPVMRVHRPDEFYSRIGRDGLIGFGESYLAGAWDADDLGGFLTVLAAEMATLVPERLQRMRAFVVAKRPHFHRPDETQSRELIAHHYDLSNDLFRLFLDPTLSYSSALFESTADGGPVLPAAPAVADLEEAQGRKIERLLDETGVGEGSRVLEIGTGWGELAVRAARRGAHVHSITLSTEQLELAQQRVAEAGFSDQVEIELCDYRAITTAHPGREYDAVVSVEMIEAVGAEYWPSYFSTIDAVLAPGGKVGIQAITMPHDRMLATTGQFTWINKYIFPGGFLPSIDVIDEVTREHTALRVSGDHAFGQHYAETLRQWDNRFLAAHDEVLALGFDEIFVRMWHFYLEYSRAGFASGYINVRQVVLDRGGDRVTTTQARPTTASGVAQRLAEAVRPFVGGDLPVRLTAWDGSSAGPEDAPHVTLRSPDAVRRMVWHPGELGAAQAYVTGELDVDGDLGDALTHAFAVAHERGLMNRRPSPGAVVSAVRAALDLGVLGRPPAPPSSQARIRGRLHSKLRDRSAISHHYDLSNEFYSLILDPAMAYSCGYWTQPAGPAYDVADAQRDKLDLVCRKLGLEPGMRMLDVGCGWGSLSLHAAEHFGAQVTGVTIAAEQKRFIDARIAERGLQDKVEIRLQDYREVPERDHFDAVGSLEMGEHVGEGNYPTYAEVLRRSVTPGGRVLVQQMSRAGGRWPGGGPFIESFIAPDMHMRPVGETAAHLERAGLEVRDVHGMREHYVWTVAGWLERFEANLPALTALVGGEVVRVWRLYLVGGMLTFRDGRMGVDQILCVRPGAEHTLSPVRDW